MEIENYIKDVSFINPICDRSKCIPVVLVCDNKNIAETMVTILSIAELKDDIFYDVVIIHNTLDEYDMAAFEHMFDCNNASKMTLRLEKVDHDFTKGYIHIDSNYKKEYVLKCFLPIILKRYVSFLYVRSGNVLKAGISHFYESCTVEYGFEALSVGNLVEVIAYNSAEFRVRYSVVDIKSSLTKGCDELDVDFLRKLSESIIIKAPDGIVEIYDDKQPSALFRELISKVPYFEKWLYERNKQDSGIKSVGTFEKPLNAEFYLFPFELVPRGAKVVLYGNGKVGHQFRQQLEITHFCELIAVADRDVRKGIVDPSELVKLEFDYIIIAIANDNVAHEIRNNLMQEGIKVDKIVYVTGRRL